MRICVRYSVWNFCMFSFLYFLFLFSPALSVWELLRRTVQDMDCTLNSQCCHFDSCSRFFADSRYVSLTVAFLPCRDLSMHPAVSPRGPRTSFRTNVYHVSYIRFVSKLSFVCSSVPFYLSLSTFVIYVWVLNLVLSHTKNKHVQLSWLCLFMLCVTHQPARFLISSKHSSDHMYCLF